MIHSVNASCCFTLLPNMARIVPNKRKERIKENNGKQKLSTLKKQLSLKKEKKGQNETKRSIWSSCLNIALYVVLCLVIPGLLNSAALQRELDALKPVGNIFEINNGQKMHMNCTGRGLPVVIMDAPTGLSSDAWYLIQEEVSKLTKVCVYDRSGLGFSERSINRSYHRPTNDEFEDTTRDQWQGQEFTSERMVDDFHQLVLAAGLSEVPLILIGSEIGAINVRFYTQLYESHVTDLVLIDPLVENLFIQDGGVWSHYWFSSLLPAFHALHIGALVGLNRIGLLIGFIHPFIFGEQIPDIVTTRQKYLLCNPRHMATVADEHYYMNETMGQLRTLWQIKSFPTNVSVTVITGNYYDEELSSSLNKAWAKAQQYLISEIHPESKHIIINGVDRHMLYRHPQAVSEPIKRLIRQWLLRNPKQSQF